MPVRIYSLAKELGIDSKECVELCAKAGVTGKGSALASLTDEEEVKVRGYIAGGSKSAGRSAAPAMA
ncbi:MAG TPA: translation initiation factor IF-2 N-terminal domain-containing protein, partial [Pirellulales bacterium]|nr:translation initiation factor IF-2 N-terminal domain-containing protein [Pirellulales bacterium]